MDREKTENMNRKETEKRMQTSLEDSYEGLEFPELEYKWQLDLLEMVDDTKIFDERSIIAIHDPIGGGGKSDWTFCLTFDKKYLEKYCVIDCDFSRSFIVKSLKYASTRGWKGEVLVFDVPRCSGDKLGEIMKIIEEYKKGNLNNGSTSRKVIILTNFIPALPSNSNLCLKVFEITEKKELNLIQVKSNEYKNLEFSSFLNSIKGQIN